jgi:glycerol-3-phosphate dehydrogenase
MIKTKEVDVLVIGGGINGVGVARDAAGRGLSVFLCEKNDLASATSSASTKLIHGGLRYLEHYEFRLVRESLKERETLLNLAPHIINPMNFVLPHHQGLRPAWLLRIGLFIYDHLCKRKTISSSKSIKFSQHLSGKALKDNFTNGFQYSDCWVDDARLVILNALSAKENGAVIATRTRFIRAQRFKGYWLAELESHNSKNNNFENNNFENTNIEKNSIENNKNKTIQIKAKTIVNAAGPWVMEQLTNSDIKNHEGKGVQLIQGSHIIINKHFEGDHAFIFQNKDNRIAFAIPYEKHFTLIGTTDRRYSDDLDKIKITEEEISYLCNAVNEYFKEPVSPDDVVSTYSGVRPLYDDGSSEAQKVTRDYVLDLNTDRAMAPILNIFGGKITTYRKLAEHALKELCPLLNIENSPWTSTEPLPGGDIKVEEFELWKQEQTEKYDFLDIELINRLAHAYGTRIKELLSNVKKIEDLGIHFGENLYEKEVEFLIQQEWANSLDDILWRRTKMGLHLSNKEKEELKNWLKKRINQ